MVGCSSFVRGRRRPWAAGAAFLLAGAAIVGFAPAALPAPTGPDYTVLAGTTISLCGVHNFGTLTIDTNGMLLAATAVSAATTTPTGADCPSAADVGELRIRADRIINHGTISADAVQPEPFTPGPSCDVPPFYSPATGNSGGPHVTPGGNGSSGTGGNAYDDLDCFEPLGDESLFPPINEGAPGAGTGPGGRGGGVIVLISNGDVVSDGEISADGENGVGNTTGTCAFAPLQQPNTGTPAPRGGGAGGSIAIVGRSLDFRGTSLTDGVHANGGRGGDSRVGPSGGGAGGLILSVGPRINEALPPVINGGPAGTNLCAGDGESVGAGDGSSGAYALLGKAYPLVSTQASAGGMAGAPVRDVATITRDVGATGTVTFRLFSDSACANQVFTSTTPVVDGSTATSGWATPAAAGTYYWTADYNGDDANNPGSSPCGAPGEAVVVTAFQAPAPNRTITGDFTGPVTVDAGQSVLITNARVVGPVTVSSGGSLSVVNSQVSRGITANAPAFFSLCGAQVTAPAPGGVALSVTNAAVPVRIGDPATGCAGNRFAGQVVVTGNLAVTFGGNTVSSNVTINNNGPGNAVVKANTVLGTLGCAGNNPPPTNAGQPNTAGAKTGQCAGL